MTCVNKSDSVLACVNESENTECVNESGNEPLECVNESENEPLECVNESGNEPLECVNESENEALESDTEHVDALESGNESEQSGNESATALESGNESENEVLESSTGKALESGNELLEFATGKALESENESENELLESATGKALESGNESENELLESSTGKALESGNESEQSGNELLEFATGKALESGNESKQSGYGSEQSGNEPEQSGNESENQSGIETVPDDINKSDIHKTQPQSNNEEDNEFWYVVDEDISHDSVQKQRLITKVSTPTKPRDQFPLMYNCCGCNKTIYRSVDMICYNERLDVIVCQVGVASVLLYDKGLIIIKIGPMFKLYIFMNNDSNVITCTCICFILNANMVQ